MDRPADLREPGRTSPMVRRATGLVLAMLDSAARSRVRIHGADSLPPGPILFVSNHFTRSETFLLPWLLDRHAGRVVSSLAWHGLFRGTFGKYLEAVGARSTREPLVKERIVRELASGECDWLIYPEGEMVKNKSVWTQGRLRMETLEQHGPAHTGAALLALQAARARRDAGSVLPLHVVPVSVTYYPIRPGPNPLLKLAGRMAGPLPESLEEELQVEGNIYFQDTDIDVVLGEPIDLESWIPPEGFQASIPHALLERLTTRMMQSVYGNTVRNLDHLVCTAISRMRNDAIHEQDLARALLLSVREIAANGPGRWHHGIGPALLDTLAGTGSRSMDDILDLAAKEGTCARQGGVLVRHRDGFRPMAYEHVRLRHGVEVLANEVAPDRTLVRSVEHWVRHDAKSMRTQATDLLERMDQEEMLREGGESGHGPRWILPESVRGVVVLAHGYLATPEETEPLARHLADHGWASYLVRLTGHGTDPARLEHVHRDDWWRSFQRGLAIAQGRFGGKPLVVAGFSTGAFPALRAAARLGHPPRGLVSINAPLKLENSLSLLAPAVDGWNRVVADLGLPSLAMPSVPNDSEFPEDNYARNPVRSLHQMELAASDIRQDLSRIRCPTLIVQGDADPVVKPESGEILMRGIASASKLLVRWPARRHGIVRGEGANALHARVAEWLDHL